MLNGETKYRKNTLLLFLNIKKTVDVSISKTKK